MSSGTSGTPREGTYVQAIREALDQELARDPSVVVFGLDVDDPKAIQGTTRGLAEKYGPRRVFGTPLSEEGMTGVAIGMALAGLKPVHVHIRMDFLMLAMNQLVNMAAKSRYMYGGQVHVPLVVRAIIGKSWGQGAQHSQGLHSFFMHVPGFSVVAPANPHDAKGCLIHAIRSEDPVLVVEHRLLYDARGPLPEESYTVGPGRSRVTESGRDVTLVGVSSMHDQCARARGHLAGRGIEAEVIDPVWLAPLDHDTIVRSVEKTRRLLVVDSAWTTCGAAAEIVARVSEALSGSSGFRVRRMGFAPVTCPPTPSLESIFYPNHRTIAAAAFDLVAGSPQSWVPDEAPEPAQAVFRGPF